MPRPSLEEYAPFYHGYVSNVSQDHASDALRDSVPELAAFFEEMPADLAQFAYAPGKWTIAQLLQHMIDTERVFAYRAMCIARGEKQGLPGFDENEYAEAAPAIHRSLDDLSEEFMALRACSLRLFESLQPNDFEKIGVASGKAVSVNALGFILAGHSIHHIKILKERYHVPHY